MRTFKITLAGAMAVAVLALAMCSGCEPEREESREFQIEFISCVIEPRPDDATSYQARVIVRIHNASVAQEITSQGVLRWREHIALRGDHTWNNDVHVTQEGEKRQICSWPSDVEGAAPDEFGTSLIWLEPGLENAGPFFARPVQGTLTHQDRSREIFWTVECLPTGVMVTLNGREHWTAK